MAIIRRNGIIQTEFKQSQLKRRKPKRLRNRAANGSRPRKFEHDTRTDWQYEQAQNRRWLDAQMQLSHHPITKLERHRLYKWFNFPSFAAQQRPATMKEGLRLSGTSKAHLARLAAERDTVRTRHAQVTGQEQTETMRVEDWWLSETGTQGRGDSAGELANSREGTKKQRDYERRRLFLAGKKKQVNNSNAGSKMMSRLPIRRKRSLGEELEKMAIDEEKVDEG